MAAKGYGWEYILFSARYMIEADLCNIGTISVTPLAGAQTKEYISVYKANGENISSIAELENEGSMLGVGV